MSISTIIYRIFVPVTEGVEGGASAPELGTARKRGPKLVNKTQICVKLHLPTDNY